MVLKFSTLLFIGTLIVSSSSFSDDQQRVAGLKRMLPGMDIGTPVETPVKGIYQVKVSGKYAYVSENGKYAFIGRLLDLDNGIDLTQSAEAKQNLPLLKAFTEKDIIEYKAIGNEKTAITVFSDTSCPYCKKMHLQVPELQKAGITVRYIPFPRGLTRGKGYKQMLAVWCAKDRVKAMDIAMGVSDGSLKDGDCGVEGILKAGFDLGKNIGVRGTPSSFLVDGSAIRGYLPAKQLLLRLESKKLLQ